MNTRIFSASRRTISVVSVVLLGAGLGVISAAPAQADVCASMDVYTQAGQYVGLLNFKYGDTYTKVQPHQFSARAEITRYSSGAPRIYYGSVAYNQTLTGTNFSYVTATNGFSSGNGYTTGSSYAHQNFDTSNRTCNRNL